MTKASTLAQMRRATAAPTILMGSQQQQQQLSVVYANPHFSKLISNC
jgi:hypothetical protein